MKELTLLQDLAAHLEDEADGLAKKIRREDGSRDPRRLYRGQIRGRIWKRDGGRCFYCKAEVSLGSVQIDHVYPWSQGGRSIEENGVASCGKCNRQKGARVW